jgi:hypothetical protein
MLARRSQQTHPRRPPRRKPTRCASVKSDTPQCCFRGMKGRGLQTSTKTRPKRRASRFVFVCVSACVSKPRCLLVRFMFAGLSPLAYARNRRCAREGAYGGVSAGTAYPQIVALGVCRVHARVRSRDQICVRVSRRRSGDNAVYASCCVFLLLFTSFFPQVQRSEDKSALFAVPPRPVAGKTRMQALRADQQWCVAPGY